MTAKNWQAIASASVLFCVILVSVVPESDAYKGYCGGRLVCETGSTPFEIVGALRTCKGEVRLEIYDREIQMISDGINQVLQSLYRGSADATGFKLASCCGTAGVGCYVNGAAPRSQSRSGAAARGGEPVTYKGVFPNVEVFLKAIKAAGIYPGMVPSSCDMGLCRTSPEAGLLKQISDGFASLTTPISTAPRGNTAVKTAPRGGYGK